ncbi:glutaredoxin [Tessaracoccus sp. MC1865]|uniref:glutaredoxin n=1 Tax=Tessaracoccus sp. MC1865 TaxID=2760310 RepID=UPI001AE96F0A|nr:glutaredoxin [Tessaracoccus sp. MC1865]QTO38201.1 glutaredoxin [Tessaracoccus sp. MC1865]
MRETALTAAPRAGTEPAEVILVTAPACHFCDDAHARLRDLQDVGLVRLRTVAADSDEGAALIAAHRPAMFPLTLVEGRRFHDGRIPRGKLARLVSELEAR